MYKGYFLIGLDHTGTAQLRGSIAYRLRRNGGTQPLHIGVRQVIQLQTQIGRERKAEALKLLRYLLRLAYIHQVVSAHIDGTDSEKHTAALCREVYIPPEDDAAQIIQIEIGRAHV